MSSMMLESLLQPPSLTCQGAELHLQTTRLNQNRYTDGSAVRTSLLRFLTCDWPPAVDSAPSQVSSNQTGSCWSQLPEPHVSCTCLKRWI